uniref:uncharacterized protein LOC120341394 n=1 Tax=Styela clava TaxID=7725 RepID=UPI00193A55F1|nr:uncharacterized protein LOC120341394 [Styela clava]
MYGIRFRDQHPSKRRKSYMISLASFAALFFLLQTTTNVTRRSLEDTSYSRKTSNDIASENSRLEKNKLADDGNITPFTDCQIKLTSKNLDVDFYERSMYTPRELQERIIIPDRDSIRSINQNPVIRLRPDKFLLPILANGPNNQIIGLREAALVAIKLNRTLVIPKFFKHISDSQIGSGVGTMTFIYPGHRLEVKDFCRFMSCISMEEFQQTCGYQIDAVMHLSRYSEADLKKFESIIGMKILNQDISRAKKSNGVKLVPRKPIDPEFKFRKFRPDEIPELFSTSKRCVIYPRPLYNLQFARLDLKNKGKGRLISSETDLQTSSDTRLWLSLSYYSRSPEYISQIAKSFISLEMGKKQFISVHWRYNKDDFMKRCQIDITHANEMKLTLCRNALLIKPTDIAMAIEDKIISLRKEGKLQHNPHLYFAAPPSERKIIEGVAKILFDRQGMTTFSSVDVEEFMKVRYNSCPSLERHFNDIMSTTEMEICTRSLVFLGSVRSSWTDNVKSMRLTSQFQMALPEFDGDIFLSSVEMREKRTKRLMKKQRDMS